jgi:hypothetical protein
MVTNPPVTGRRVEQTIAADGEIPALVRLVRNDPDGVVGFENQTGMTSPVAATAYLSLLTCPRVDAASLRALRIYRDRRRGFGNAF